MRMTRWVLAAAVLSIPLIPASSAAVKTREVDYKQGTAVLQGFFAWDDAQKGRRPGVLVVHEWWGHNEHARNQAKRLAQAGYVAFALDMYGKGKVTTHPKDAEAFMTEATKDPKIMIARFNAALEQLKRDPRVDPGKIAAIGYCFGGAVVLNMARAGADRRRQLPRAALDHDPGAEGEGQDPHPGSHRRGRLDDPGGSGRGLQK